MPTTDASILQDNVEAKANAALARGATVAAIFALVNAIVVGAFSTRYPHMRASAAFVVLCFLFCAALALLARARSVRAAAAWAVFIAFAVMPGAFFLVAEALAPLGALTYLYGPIATVSCVIIALSGLMFDASLARWVGAAAGLSYFGAYLVARQHMGAINWVDEGFRIEMTAPHIHAVRGALLWGLGLVVGAMANSARRLVEDTVAEHRERDKVSRLFGQYVSDEVRDAVLKTLADAKGERAVVAVLFADLRGFTAWSERVPPHELVERLNLYFDAMVTAVRAHGGRVDKFIGDAVMAVFGGLLPLEDPARAAVAAARAMRGALAELNARWQAQGLPPLDNGVGIHHGEVLQGPLGSETRKEFAVLGDVVNTASRLESATRELGRPVVLSEAVWQLLPETDRAGLEPLGEVKLKGKELPVRVYGLRA